MSDIGPLTVVVAAHGWRDGGQDNSCFGDAVCVTISLGRRDGVSLLRRDAVCVSISPVTSRWRISLPEPPNPCVG